MDSKRPLTGPILDLNYAVISHPNPIIVSSEGTTPNLVDLTIIVSNPHTYLVALDKIEIKIPVGEDSARSLSTDPSLPTPIYDTSKPWLITVSGNIVTITSKDGQSLEITEQSVNFKLNDIGVNDVVGIVPLTITEYSSDSAKISDTDTYTLMKLQADYPVTNFYAKPEIFYRNGERTLLYWDCSEYGEECVYKVHSDSWRPSNLYTAQDGQTGVQSAELYVTITFALDIYQPNSDGNQDYIDTLYTTVPVVVPALYDTNCQTNVGGIQRLVKLYWTAQNASRCEIHINGKIYINDAPTNTNPDGYLLLIGETDVSDDIVLVNIAVIAYSEDDKANASYQVPSILMKSLTQHVMSYATPASAASLNDTYINTYGIGLTPDNTQAFVLAMNVTFNSDSLVRGTPFLNRIALTDFSCQAIALNEGDVYMRSCNVVATNEFAYTSLNVYYPYDHTPAGGVNYLKRVTLSNNYVDSFNGLGGDVGLALTADNQHILMAHSPYTSVFKDQVSGVVSVNTDTLDSSVPLNLDQTNCIQTAITPNQQWALMTSSNDKVSVVDITQLDQGVMTLNKTLSVGSAPMMTAISSDGTFALVANSGSANLSVINLETMTVETNTIAVGQAPYGIAITADNQYAYVVNKHDGTLMLVDIKNRCSIPGAIIIGSNPVAVAITNNGRVLVIQADSTILTNLPV
jgi:YVTN family beta-propeller protein